MSDEKMIINVKPGGKVTIKVIGHAGPGCTSLTEGLRRALGGTVESDAVTPEFYARPVEQKREALR